MEPPAAAIDHAPAPARHPALVLLAVAVAIYVLDAATGFTGDDGRAVLRDWGNPALQLLAAAAIFARARQDRRRAAAWIVLAAGITCYALGYVVQSIEGPPVDSTAAGVLANVLWLAFYPAAYVALVLLARRRTERFHASLWLDGLVAGLALGAVASAFVLPHLLEEPRDEGVAQLVAALVWPTGDLALLAMALWILSLTGGRPGRLWVLICTAFGLFAAGDIALVHQVSAGTYERGSLVSAPYAVACLLLAAAAWQPPETRHRPRMHEHRVLLLPAACAAVALVLLAVDQADPLPSPTSVLALAALAVAMARAALSLRELRALQESRRFERGFEDALIGMALLSPDLRLLRVNRAFARMLGRTPAALVGQPIGALTDPDDTETSPHIRDRALAGDRSATFTKRFVRPDGRVVEALISTTLVDDPDSDEPYFFSQVQDVTEERLRRRRQEALADLGRDAVAVTDVGPLMHRAAVIVTDALRARHCTIVEEARDGLRFVAASRHDEVPWALVLPSGTGSQAGFTLLADETLIANDLPGETRFDVPDVVSRRDLARGLSAPIRQRDRTAFAIVVHATAARERFSPEDARFLEAVANVLGSALDRVGAEDEVRRQALHDPLTGLANRALLFEQLEQAIRATERHSGHTAVLLLDIDRFKAVNDTLGHAAGDELLRAVAERLRHAVRDGDVVARLGGDEFVILIREAEDDVLVAEVAERVVRAFAEPFDILGSELQAAASVGLAIVRSSQTAPDALLRDADVAMYRAKERGGARYEAFDAALRERLVHRLTVETELRRALENGELRLHFQPVVDLADARIAGFEGLLRWEHPQRGLLLPGDFIGVAEESELIRPIGAWVLESACAQLARWKASPDTATRLSVNLSPRQLTPSLVSEVGDLLDAHHLAPDDLMLEIAESLILAEAHVDVLAGLRDLGVTLALDDFGTGHSSLASLQHQPIQAVKLDRSFVRTLGASAASTTIVRAVVDMASALDVLVVAEGVEDSEQARTLFAIGCRRAQGFLFGRPEPAPIAEALLRASGTVPLVVPTA